MIRKVAIKGFKRFGDVTFTLPGHVVVAGPNNTGKTTLLQAIAAWSLAFSTWLRRNDFQRHGGAYTKVPITRQVFSAVPLRAFDLLWTERAYGRNPIEITLEHGDGWTVTMEFLPDTSEQILVRPKPNVDPQMLAIGLVNLSTVFVPPMTGLSTDEPVLQQPKIEQLLGQGKPGEVLRNLLVVAHQQEQAWEQLTGAIKRLFGYELLPPNAAGADILAEYRTGPKAPNLDIASAGSGFQQVLMLLTFLNTRAGSVLLLDEPDAHLHLILQDAIYGELRTVAQRQRSQLIVATHSEVIINAVEPRELCVLLQQPRMLSDSAEKSNLIRSLSVLSNADIMLAIDSPGVLYTEGHTDISILKEWARILGHPVLDYFTRRLFWRPTVWENRLGAHGIEARDHFEALSLVRDDLPGLVLLDGDANPSVQATDLPGKGLQRVRWRRYEIESYLVHPDALARYVAQQVGGASADQHVADLRRYLEQNLPPAVLKDPLGDHVFLNNTKARTDLIPPALAAAGLPGIPYTRFHEIAAVMETNEIHPEVREKLDAIQKAFNL
jgi:ABC-type branched-subunit amino acid transport system ATPase component